VELGPASRALSSVYSQFVHTTGTDLAVLPIYIALRSRTVAIRCVEPGSSHDPIGRCASRICFQWNAGRLSARQRAARYQRDGARGLRGMKRVWWRFSYGDIAGVYRVNRVGKRGLVVAATRPESFAAVVVIGLAAALTRG